MKLRKEPTKYIKDKVQQLLSNFVFLKTKIRKCDIKRKQRESLATGYDEGQSNFYQKSISNCKKQIQKIRAILEKIGNKYLLKNQEKKVMSVVANKNSTKNKEKTENKNKVDK